LELDRVDRQILEVRAAQEDPKDPLDLEAPSILGGLEHQLLPEVPEDR
jgi:hypothetical protein